MISEELKGKAVTEINNRLSEKAINRWCNSPVKRGYTEALRVLNNNIESYEDIKCKGVQSRAIAALAIDFLQGKESLEMLTRVPIKK